MTITECQQSMIHVLVVLFGIISFLLSVYMLFEMSFVFSCYMLKLICFIVLHVCKVHYDAILLEILHFVWDLLINY